ncbi:MAG TPA: 50S ribosomal protein L4 [Solirubrobacter sp.]|nr:50S ribosomal protein L4 [Solirubrobacter sp.]
MPSNQAEQPHRPAPIIRPASALGGGTAVELDTDVFGQPFNGPLVHEVVVAELAARRQGTHSTKTRGMVSGGSAKPWRQKGTGRARAGTSRSPIWTGGGTVFGPSPRSYVVKVNRKARRAALRSALSVHAERGTIYVVDAASFSEPSTAKAAELLDGHLGGAVLVALADDELTAARSFRNIARVGVLHVDDVGVADLVRAATLVLSQGALDNLTARARKEAKV